MKLNDVISEVLREERSNKSFKESVVHYTSRFARTLTKLNVGRVGEATLDDSGKPVMNGMIVITDDGQWHYQKKSNSLIHLGLDDKETVITVTPELRAALKKFL